MCEEGYDRLLEKLLDKGADPNARDQAKANKPAIVLATEGNHTECIKLLMVSSVDKNAVYDATEICALHRYMYMYTVTAARDSHVISTKNKCSVATAYFSQQQPKPLLNLEEA